MRSRAGNILSIISRRFASRLQVAIAAVAVAAVAAAGFAAAGTVEASHPSSFANPLYVPPVLTGSDITLDAAEANVQLLSGQATKMWTYNGTFPGPTIRRPTGQATRVTLNNNLPATAGELSLHNHGNHSSSDNDGQPATLLVPPGGSRTYTYTGAEGGGNERGTTQWYHDHRMDMTARNVWMGLAGFYIIDDPADPQTLPSGGYDVPLAITDRSFDRNNQIPYTFSAAGVTGDHFLVNGVVQPYFNAGDRKYRLRILNASNIRDYELQLSNGDSFLQIGTESGLLPQPISRTSITLSPAERVDVVVDFTGKLGQNIVLRNALENGSAGDLMQFRVNSDVTDDSSVPASLRPIENIGDPVVTRTFNFGRNGGRWTINDLPFDANRVDARPQLGTTERWVLNNNGGWSHTVHIHDVDQQALTRNGGAPPAYESVKESWNIGGGQTVEVKLKFTDHTGRYVIHCHVLEHEDEEMMTQFEVVAPSASTDTGARSPSAERALTGGDGNGFETNPGGAFADAGTFSSNIDGAGDRHEYSNYGIGAALPAGATITGIETRADWWIDGNAGASSLSVELSSDGGATWTAAKSDARESTVEHTGLLGGTSDLWGRAWSVSDFTDANFRVRVTSNSNRAARDFYLDWLPVKVYYTP